MGVGGLVFADKPAVSVGGVAAHKRDGKDGRAQDGGGLQWSGRLGPRLGVDYSLAVQRTSGSREPQGASSLSGGQPDKPHLGVKGI